MLRNSSVKYALLLTARNKPFNWNARAQCARQLFVLPNLTEKKKEYSGRKIVGYSMQQMFDVVSDVGNYNKFVPFCKKSVVRKKSADFLQADLKIGFPPIVESYTSNVTLIQPFMVKAECVDGKLFHYLETTWKFTPALKSKPQSCIIDFYVAFEFRSLLHSQLAHIVFDKLVRQMEGAFINEARNRFGKESLATQQLSVAKNS